MRPSRHRPQRGLRALLAFAIVVVAAGHARGGERARPYRASHYDVQLAVHPAP